MNNHFKDCICYQVIKGLSGPALSYQDSDSLLLDTELTEFLFLLEAHFRDGVSSFSLLISTFTWNKIWYKREKKIQFYPDNL